MPQGAAVLSRLRAGAELPVAQPVPAAELVSRLEEQPRPGARVAPVPAGAVAVAREPQSEPGPEVSLQPVASAEGAGAAQDVQGRPSLPSFE